ncbi:MAG: long-chain fatty acid--CoA ligase [Candidatus Dadabacteria bacterium]|nr:MAG: long-chain fatty acid--CoA ligase [Candidatus Dadabacteria bacterium]
MVDLPLDTFPKLLRHNARKWGDDRVAMREKEFGIWQPYTWKDYYEHVKYFCLGLVSMGLQKGDTIAIIGDNRPEWLWAELAAQSAGAIGIGIYQDSILKEVSYIINHAASRFVVAEDQEQVDKVLDMGDEIPTVEHIIYTDPRGMRKYDDSRLIYFPEVEERGREFEKKNPGIFDQMVDATNPEDCAQICTTSGTTGNPKLAMLSHRNMLSMAANLGKVDPKYESDEFVSFLPLPWIGEQMMCVASALLFGFTVNFPEEPETATENIREIGPHVIFSPPRVWENLAATVQVKIMDASPFKRFMFNKCLPIGYMWADLKFQKKEPTLWQKIQYAFAYLTVFRALKDRLGFTYIRSASTGGAALGPDTFRFFHALGVNLKQIYGQTEISGISCIHRDGDIKFDTVGKPIPETEIQIANPDPKGVGEVISRSPALFMGYYKNEEATRETIVDGWLYSGDAGYFDEDGHLVIIDRMKDIMTLKGGERFSPQFIENKLKFSPFVKEAVCIGHERDYIIAMICIDYGIVGKWAEDRRINYTTYTDLASKPEVYDLIEKEVRKVNETLTEHQRIRKFVLLYKELDADDDELTRTRKVRRRFIDQKYAEIIEGIYAGRDQIHIDTVIRYQDGKTSQLKTTLAVRTLE